MEMHPQGYPLIAQGEDGGRYLVIGWTMGEGTSPEPGDNLVPVVVPTGPDGIGPMTATTLPLTYALPAGASRRAD